MTYETLTTQVTVVKAGGSLFDESATRISIVDDAAGEYVIIEQARDGKDERVCINPEEWQALMEAISLMVSRCRS